MEPRKYTKTAFISYVQAMISQEERSISIEMDLINRSGFALDVVDRAARLRQYCTSKDTLERLIKYIDADWK